MRFGRVLHPEIVLDKRGDTFDRLFLKTALSIITIEPEHGLHWNVRRSDEPLTQMIAEALVADTVMVRFLVSCKFFASQNAPVYHIGQEFLQALQKIDRKVPVDILPEKFSAYFSFASKTLFDESDAIEGGYVCIDRGRNLGMDAKFADTRIITFAYVCSKEPGVPAAPVGSLTVPLDAKTLEELASGAPLQDFWGFFQDEVPSAEKNAKRNEIFRTLLNCVIYLHSDEPIIEKTVPLAESNKSIKEHKRDGTIINACTIPVQFLWPHYKPVRNYTVGSTWVDSFPRWQRCGPGLTSVKLIFVTAHERTYNKPFEEPITL